ncbi:putative leader peptide [Pseudonocardia eucalypti]|uniref:putative leader peptide n=1 Tax=Pseudonocardia eucalypti TaxID=648755 RepID=UPI003CD0914F
MPVTTLPTSRSSLANRLVRWHHDMVSCALNMRLVARRHVDFQRVSSAMCRSAA